MNDPTSDTQSPSGGKELPTGTRVEEFVIEKVLGSGGFGITYLARDTSLDRQVVIKENLPSQFAHRDTSSLTVWPGPGREDQENFRWSLENFSKEAAMLASLRHPGIVPVLRRLEAFGTAYFVMPFVEGITLDELIEERRAEGKPFSEAELRGLLEHVLAALDHLHDRGIYHRDIKPGNILITNDGVPVLIDFGSARQRLSERSMTVVESPGYTPFEQLQSRGNVGPWSDLYALGGTLAKAITGEAPPKANDRAFDDPWVPLARQADLCAIYSTRFLASIDRALACRIEERWKNAGEWLASLQAKTIVAADPPVMASPLTPPAPHTLHAPKASPASHTWHAPSTPVKKGNPRRWIIAACVILGLGAWGMLSSINDTNGAAKVIKVIIVNSLGMKFVPVKITGGPSAGQQVLFSIWETRVQDYRRYAAAKSEVDGEWKNPGFTQGEDHPVVNVSWEDAMAFCEWLTQAEHDSGKIPATAKYRLPTDHEWSCAVGIGEREDAAVTPESKDNKMGEVYPWGAQWPPPKNAGNYAVSLNVDDYERTSPVGRFAANANGIFDLGGNVWEWCEDLHRATSTARVVRGGSWDYDGRVDLRSAFRFNVDPRLRYVSFGFRVVLVGGGG
jgi:serine/threonine protein kinase